MKFHQGGSMLATTREKFEFGVSLTDVRDIIDDPAKAELYIKIPAAFTGVEILGAVNLRMRRETSVAL